MSFTFDVFDTVKKPNVYLCQVDKEIIGALKVFNASFTDKFNDINEFSFSVSRQYIDTYGNEIINPIYEMVQGIRIVYVEGIGYFEIQEPNINSNGIYEIKECTALSLEQDLTKKYLKTFIINQGTTASIDGVTFYNSADQSHSLMHLVLEKLPQWSIGHIDGELVNMSRYFEVDEQDVYSFLINEVSETFRCVFKFNTYNNTINAYTYENSGEDTSLYISYKNLANEIGISYTADDIVTCLTVKGAEDLDVSGVNMGQDSILDLSYYHTVDDMGQELYDAWNDYISIYNLKKPDYEALVVTIEGLYDDYSELNNRIPDDTTSENWTLYGLSYLNIKKSLFENNVQFQAELGWAESSNLNHATYTLNKNKLNAINAEIKVRESQIKSKENQISTVQSQMRAIADEVNYQNNFTSTQLKKLSKFIREGTWQDDNFLITETDTPNQIIAIQQELLNNGEKYLKQLSQPQLEFDMSMANILALPEFKKISDKFKVGNYIYVTLRDGYSFKVRLLEYTFSFDELNSFNATFGNLTRLKDETDKAADILDQARSSGKSVAAWKSRWQSGASTAVSIEQMIKDGLSTSVTNIKSSNNRNDITIDQTGIRMRTLKDDGTYSNKEGWITGNSFLYSNDNFATAKSAFGEFTVNGETKYGLLAEAVIAGDVIGTNITGSTITGTTFNNGNGTFMVDENGKLTASDATITGKIKTVEPSTGEYAVVERGGVYFYTQTGAYSGSIETGYNSLDPTLHGVSIFVPTDRNFSVLKAGYGGHAWGVIFEIPRNENALKMQAPIDMNNYHIKNIGRLQDVTGLFFREHDAGVFTGLNGRLIAGSSEGVSLGLTDGSTSVSPRFTVTSDQLIAYANLNMSGYTITNQSDIRLKKSIKDTEINGILWTKKQRLIEFEWNEEYSVNKDKPAGKQFGLEAQYAGEAMVQDVDTHYYSIDLGKQINLNTLTNQELIKKVEALEISNNLLVKLYDELKSKLLA